MQATIGYGAVCLVVYTFVRIVDGGLVKCLFLIFVCRASNIIGCQLSVIGVTSLILSTIYYNGLFVFSCLPKPFNA